MTQTNSFGAGVPQSMYPSMTQTASFGTRVPQSMYPSMTQTASFGTRVPQSMYRSMTQTTNFGTPPPVSYVGTSSYFPRRCRSVSIQKSAKMFAVNVRVLSTNERRDNFPGPHRPVTAATVVPTVGAIRSQP